jgi:hypothetical protein
MHARSRPVLVFERLQPGSRMSWRDAGSSWAALHSVVSPAGPSTTWWRLSADHYLSAQKRDKRPSQERLGRRTHQIQRASTSRRYKKSPAFTQERPVWFPKNASRCPKESRTKSSLSLVTLTQQGTNGQWMLQKRGIQVHEKRYEKMRSVSQKARVRCPLP